MNELGCEYGMHLGLFAAVFGCFFRARFLCLLFAKLRHFLLCVVSVATYAAIGIFPFYCDLATLIAESMGKGPSVANDVSTLRNFYFADVDDDIRVTTFFLSSIPSKTFIDVFHSGDFGRRKCRQPITSLSNLSLLT